MTQSQNQVVRVVVADQSVTIQKVFELAFSGSEFQIVVASSCAEVESELQEGPVALLYLNVALPGCDAYRLCRQVREGRYGPGPKVVLLRPPFFGFDKAAANQARPDAVLKKPFNSARLVSEARRLVPGVR